MIDPPRAAAFDQFATASVAMLDPLVACPPQAPAEQWLPAVVARIDRTAALARAARLTELARYLAGIAGGLEARRSDPPSREVVAAWLEAVIGLSAGRSIPDAVERLARQAAQMGARDTATSLRELLADDLEALERHGAVTVPAGHAAASVGSDELDMLAQACDELAGDLESLPLSSPPLTYGMVAERIGYLVNALRFMGLSALADLFEHFAGCLHVQASTGQALDGEHAAALLAWPQRWSTWFADHGQSPPDQALAIHSLGLWHAPGLLAQARESLDRLQLVGSRQVEQRPDDVSAQDLSLQIPVDADRDVVDTLLRELPLLVGEFTDAVTAIAGDEFGELASARRTAHTIKGSANTVGVQGVANLTHALEDLLQLLEQHLGPPDAAAIDTLCAGADCLAEMVESLSGLGQPPEDPVGVYRSVLAQVNRIVDERERLFAEQADGAHGAAGSVLTAWHPSQGEDATDIDAVGDGRDDEAGTADRINERDDERDDERADDDEELPALPEVESAGMIPAFNLADFDLPDLELTPRPVQPPDDPAAASQPVPVADTVGAPEPLGIEATLDVPVLGAASTWAAWSGGLPAGGRLRGRASDLADEDLQAEDLLGRSSGRLGSPTLRVAASIIEQLLESADEAVIALSELQDVVREMSLSHRALRDGSERLDSLSVELDRLVDAAPAAAAAQSDSNGFDPLELERYGELHTASRRITEAAADSKLLEQQIDQHLDRASSIVDKLERVQSVIRERSLRARMIDADSIAPRLQRAARQAARLAGKVVELQVKGGETAVDGETLQRLVKSLAHLVRNAVDHGIEDARARRAAGKPPAGAIVVSFEREVSAVTIIVQDDGAGFDLPAIQRRAVQLGLLPEGGELDMRAAAQLILAPGFTTRDRPSQLSGRGIGLDVVNQAVRQLRGAMSVTSEPGTGTRFELTMPLQLTSLSAFVLRSATHVIAMSIRGIDRIMADLDSVEHVDDGMRLDLDGRRIEVRRLDEVLGLPEGMLAHDPVTVVEVLLIVRLPANALVGVLVPEPGQARQVVLRALPDYMPRIPGIDGVAVLGDGAVASVIDLPEMLAHTANAGPDPRRLGRIRQSMPVCLVVDDSVSVRRAMAHFMVDIGLHCEAAADGQEALQIIDRQVPDLVVLDLEMPRMNGIELTQALRRDERTRQVPVVMITSRQSEKHRAMAMTAGVDVFLTKPYSEDELASVVGRCLAG